MLNKGTSYFLNSQLLVWSRLIIVIDKWLSYSFFLGGGMFGYKVSSAQRFLQAPKTFWIWLTKIFTLSYFFVPFILRDEDSVLHQ